MMRKLKYIAKRLQILTMAWLATKSDCLALRWGLVGIMRAEVTDGRYKGLPLGAVMALDNLDRES